MISDWCDVGYNITHIKYIKGGFVDKCGGVHCWFSVCVGIYWMISPTFTFSVDVVLAEYALVVGQRNVICLLGIELLLFILVSLNDVFLWFKIRISILVFVSINGIIRKNRLYGCITFDVTIIFIEIIVLLFRTTVYDFNSLSVYSWFDE